MEWLLLTVLGFVAFSGDDSSSSSSSSGGGAKLMDDSPDHDTIRMTCTEALAMLPIEEQAPIGSAINLGKDPNAMRRFGDALRDRAADPSLSDALHAAYLILGHCLDARADELTKPIFPVDDYSDPYAETASTYEATRLRGGMLAASRESRT